MHGGFKIPNTQNAVIPPESLRGAGALKIQKTRNAVIPREFGWGMGRFKIPDSCFLLFHREYAGTWGGCVGDTKYPISRIPLVHKKLGGELENSQFLTYAML